MFTVNIAGPDVINRLNLQVRLGPNDGYKRQFSVGEYLSGKES